MSLVEVKEFIQKHHHLPKQQKHLGIVKMFLVSRKEIEKKCKEAILLKSGSIVASGDIKRGIRATTRKN